MEGYKSLKAGAADKEMNLTPEQREQLNKKVQDLVYTFTGSVGTEFCFFVRFKDGISGYHDATPAVSVDLASAALQSSLNGVKETGSERRFLLACKFLASIIVERATGEDAQ